MPLAFLIIGILFIASAVNGTSKQLIGLLKSDFTGQNNFLFWLVAIVAIGAVGAVDELKPISKAFFVLLIISMLIANSPKGGVGIFDKLLNQIKESQTA